MIATWQAPFTTSVRKLALASIVAIALSLSTGAGARADSCPAVDPSDDQTCDPATPSDATPPSGDGNVEWFDASGAPIPYVEETTAPADGTALTFTDPN